jgi:hypothetical protein
MASAVASLPCCVRGEISRRGNAEAARDEGRMPLAQSLKALLRTALAVLP